MRVRGRCTSLIITAAAVLVLATAGVALAQFGFGGFREPYQPLPNIRYDGRFTFVRVRYTPAPGGLWPGRRPSWIHGYPLAERNLMQIMNEVSLLGAHDDINTVTFDDPELFKYPIAYLIEVGWWTVTDREAQGLRAYLLKGGFLFIDDFKRPGWRVPGGGWEPFAETMRRVLPGVQFFDLDPRDPVFHSFFEINDLKHFPQAYVDGDPIFRGIFEDNDRSKRLMAIINYNTDVSQFWEWSGRGLRPFDQTNEAYKLGVNYLIYGLTH
ncbi:MAG TPA: DUF4159 domain-containing protein [Vicinamibacterales bacterium]|nr:DUF4159 domain-containing protein [Vicinamibacterales bacterium]